MFKFITKIAFAAVIATVVFTSSSFAGEADDCEVRVDSLGKALAIVHYDGKQLFALLDDPANPKADGSDCFATVNKISDTNYRIAVSWGDDILKPTSPTKERAEILKLLFDEDNTQANGATKPQKVLFPPEPTMETIPAPRVDNSTTSSIGGDESMLLNLDEYEDMLSDIADANDALASAIAMKFANAK